VAVWSAPHQSLVTVDRRKVHVLGADVDLVEASLVTLGAIAELGVARSGGVAGRSVVVVGAGAIGLLAQRVAAAAGALSCTVLAASTAKDRIVRGDSSAALCPPAGVDRLHGDVVIEATGATAGVELALRAAGTAATVVLLGTTRAEAVDFPLDLLEARGLRIVGAHAGLLDIPGGVDGLDRGGAAVRFLDRHHTRAVRLDDLVTDRVDPADAAALYHRLAVDRSLVVPVLEWWRLAPELRAHPGALRLPNLLRHGLATIGSSPRSPTLARADVVEHPPAPPRPAASERPSAGRLDPDEAWAIESLAKAAVGVGHRVRVPGEGRRAARVRQAVGELGGLAPAMEPVDVVVDVEPSASSVAGALADLGAAGTLLVAGATGAVALDVQSLIHKRGTTVLGWAPDQRGDGAREGVRSAAAPRPKESSGGPDVTPRLSDGSSPTSTGS
jgi:hypothetical protein